jgi:hypothetical protein
MILKKGAVRGMQIRRKKEATGRKKPRTRSGLACPIRLKIKSMSSEEAMMIRVIAKTRISSRALPEEDRVSVVWKKGRSMRKKRAERT